MLFWKKEVIMEKYFKNTRGNDQKLPERISPTKHLGEILPSLDDWFKDLSSKTGILKTRAYAFFESFMFALAVFLKKN